MARVKGTVTGCGKGKFSYFIKLDGKEFYYNTKFEPKCKEGDVVGIEYLPKGGGRGNIQKIKVLQQGSGPSPKFGGSSGGPAGGDRQDSIIWQSCQKVAAQLVQSFVTTGAIASKGTPDSKSAEIKGKFDELTVSLFDDAANPRASNTYKDIKKLDEDAGEPEAPAQEGEDDDKWDDEVEDEWEDDSGSW